MVRSQQYTVNSTRIRCLDPPAPRRVPRAPLIPPCPNLGSYQVAEAAVQGGVIATIAQLLQQQQEQLAQGGGFTLYGARIG